MWKRVSQTSVLLVALAVTCWAYKALLETWSVTVPQASGLTCLVYEGEAMSVVRDRCGMPCGHGFLPIGNRYARPRWPSQIFEMCGPSCDVYGTIAICYCDSATTFVEVRADDSALRSCRWK